MVPATKATATAAAPRARRTLPPALCAACLPFLNRLLELFVGEFHDLAHGYRHVVDRALTESRPVLRIRIETVARRVVVIVDDVQDRPFRDQRLRVRLILV